MSDVLPIASSKQTWRVVGGLLTRRPRLVIVALAASLAAAVLGVSAPYLLGLLVDAIGSRSVSEAITVLVGLAVVAVLGGLTTAWSYRLIIALSSGLLADLREQVIDSALDLDAQTLERTGTGDVAARISGDVEVVNESAQTAVLLVGSILTVLVSLVGFATLDWRLALAFLTVMIIYVPSLRWYVPTAGRRYATERKASGRRTHAILTATAGAPTIHAYGMERRQSETIGAASRSWIRSSLHALRAMQTFANTMNMAEAVGLSAVLLTGFLLVRADAVTVGAVTAAALMFHRLFSPLGFLLFTFDDVQAAGAALARLVGVADLERPVRDPDAVLRRDIGLAARGLSHRYGDGPLVLDRIDLDVPAGETLAVVGTSGAGKTTLAALLGGVFPARADPTSVASSSIMINEDRLDDLDVARLRQRVGVVTQEVHVFSGTLREDLQLARPGAGDDELHRALDRIGATGWLDLLEDGLDTRIGEGGRQLSAAQAQQLALARLLLVDPPVVILDEATAEAGSAGARMLDGSARALLAGRTGIVVAHRLSQAAECDRIVVMEAGRIVECGPHHQLVAAGGRYAALWSAWRGDTGHRRAVRPATADPPLYDGSR